MAKFHTRVRAGSEFAYKELTLCGRFILKARLCDTLEDVISSLVCRQCWAVEWRRKEESRG